jgi:hypothetical protein
MSITKIATPDQILANGQQKLTMKIQAQNLLIRIDRRIQVAIEAGNGNLASQLQIERELMSKQCFE